MDLNSIPKFIINLERRTDRLENIVYEMQYMDWDYTIFPAVDMNDHKGCSLSHVEIIKIAKEQKLKEVLVIEDDCFFMPYAKHMVELLSSTTKDLLYSIINLSPTFNRKVNLSSDYKFLIDLTNLPEKIPTDRGNYATNMILYHESVYDKVLEMEIPLNLNYVAIDEFFNQQIYPYFQSYSPILPIAPQRAGWSDVSQGEYSNFFVQTYQWNNYCPTKIPNQFLDFSKNEELKRNKQHILLDYEN